MSSVSFVIDTQFTAASVALFAGFLALVIAAIFAKQVLDHDQGGPEMRRISGYVFEGAKAFLHTEYKFLAVFVVVLAIVIGVIIPTDQDDLAGLYTAISFVVGAVLSAMAGYFGMLMATAANARTAWACKEGLLAGLNVAFRSGAVMALSVVGFGLIGLTVLNLLFNSGMDTIDPRAFNYLSGFGFGASSIALFARVAGGIFTKAADVGADLVGKVENSIPEDDPRNPATIADNVGDNVGDVAGMGADLFESYVGSLIAAGSLASSNADLALAYWIAGFGVVCSLIGVVLVLKRPLDNNADLETLLWTIRYGIFLAGFFVTIVSLILTQVMFESNEGWKRFGCIIVGLVSGILIGLFTEYCTSYSYRPTASIRESAVTGGATVIIRGLGVGMLSVIVPTLAVGVAILACNALIGNYGIALAAVGMLSTLSITLATDAYGPVADNAGGIAEMVPDSELSEETRDRTDALDALGNTTAATGKGFAIGSAVLTSAGLIAAFTNTAGVPMAGVPLTDPVVLTGLLIGAAMPFLFAALTMLSVSKGAEAVIVEVRRQFTLAPELKIEGHDYPVVSQLDGQSYPQHDKCVAICVTAAIQEMVLPGVIAVFAPPCIGFALGTYGLTGMLGGSLTSGFMLAVTMSNAGGAWDNAKKLQELEKGNVKAAKAACEAGEMSEQEYLQIKSTYHTLHEAVVTGDTVGDPFKDTSGPALNILIKLMSVVSLVIAPIMKDMDNVDGFKLEGVLAAIIVFLAVLLLSIIALVVFSRQNSAREAEVAEATRKAQEVFNAQQSAGAGAGAAVAVAKPDEAAAPVDAAEVKADVADEAVAAEE